MADGKLVKVIHDVVLAQCSKSLHKRAHCEAFKIFVGGAGTVRMRNSTYTGSTLTVLISYVIDDR